MAQRKRAPHRSGRRTTLTVPERIYAEAARLAEEIGTTANDALIRLADEGAAARARRAEIAALTQQRRLAIERIEPDTAGFPSPDELRAAMLSGRRDDVA